MKYFKVVLKTSGPVHVGEGKVLKKKDIVFDYHSGKVLVMDPLKIYKGLNVGRQRDSYEGFLSNREKDLLRWFKSMNIASSSYSQWTKYVLSASGMRNIGDINACIKDPYGNPYIPGSSIKGAFRTLFMSEWIRELKRKGQHPELEHLATSLYQKARLASERRIMSNLLTTSANHLENYFWKKSRGDGSAPIDLARSLIVSDSAPLSVDDLMLAAKIDRKETDPPRKQTRINLVREAIKPKTQIEFRLGLDVAALGLDEDFSLEDIQRMIANFHQHYFDVYIRYFQEDWAPEGSYFYLGGGSGFYTKTVLYELLAEHRDGEINYHRPAEIAEKWMNFCFRNHKHKGDAEKWGYSPRMLKLTQVGQQLTEMGRVQLDFPRCVELQV